jgi:tRNA nucleotidyltransferase (CCA-adding enzyme)
VRALRAIASRFGEGVWIVGGAARDLQLDRGVPEVDAVVSGNLDGVAAALESEGFGRAVPLSKRPPRVFRIAGQREIDLAEIEGVSIEEDLRRRDFTVNAIAFDLTRGRWLDPFGGLRDLAAKRLRMVSARNLKDDPLRVLRAARFLATHGLEPDRATSAACRQAAPGLADVAPERVRAEWVRLLEAPRVEPAIAWAGRVGALGPALRVPAARAGKLERAAGRFDAPAIRRLPPGSRRRVRLALVAAEIVLGAEDSGAWLAARRYGRAESGEVAALLDLASRARRTRDAREDWAWVRDAGDRTPEALALFAALSRRRLERARILRLKRRRRPRRRPRVTGADVLAWLRVSPGPDVGRLLAELEIEILRGAVRSRRQARTWLSGQGPGGR